MEKQEQKKGDGMKIVHVIPISKGITKEQLTYFSAKDILPGCIVSVPLRSKMVDAIVLGVESAEVSKTELKSSSYSIKKIGDIKARHFFLPSFVKAALEAAHYYGGTSGALMHALTPSALSSYPTKVLPKEKLKAAQREATPKVKQEPLLVQSEDKDRISTYKSIIREEFAKRASVFFCLPEISEIEHIKATLEKGIEEYTYVFHSTMTKKEILENWKAALEETHPILVIGTGAFLSLPRSDIGTIIVEKESSRAYKMSTRPFVDIRMFAEIFARLSGIRLIMGDIFLRPETLWKQEQGVYSVLSALAFRSLSVAAQEVIDMRQYTDKFGAKKFRVLSDALLALIQKMKGGNESLFILTARRGLYPLTVCSDCGSSVMCERCSAPVVLHNKDAKNKNEAYTAICHKCGFEQDAPDRCVVCSGWRLTTLGVGIEHIEEELQKQAEGLLVLRMDRDSVKTHKQAIKLRDKFYASPGSILVGTEMAIAYLDRSIENVAVLSVDSLFTIPDFRINERIFNMLLRVRALALKRFYIQTRDAENKIFDYITKGNLVDFYREEIAERKALHYPPFTTLIKLTLMGKQSQVEKEMRLAGQKLETYKPEIFPAFITTIKGKYRMNMLIRIPRGEWVNETLLGILRALPPQFAVRVDPEDVL